MKRGYRYRAYPTKAQTVVLDQQLAAARAAFNLVVRAQRDTVAKGGKVLTAYESCALLSGHVKSQNGAWMRVASQVALQQAAMAATQSYRRHLTSMGTTNPQRPPRIKIRSRGSHAMTYTRAAFAKTMAPKQTGIRRGAARIPKLGVVVIAFSRDVPSEPSSMTLTRKPDGCWYVSFVCEVEPNPLPAAGRVAGIDLGIGSHHVLELSTTDATVSQYEIPGPSVDAKLARRLQYETKRLRRMQPGSTRHRRQAELVARLYAKPRRQRKDQMRKAGLDLLRRNDVVAVESLSIRDMEPHFEQAMRNTGSQTFLALLGSKAEVLGRDVRAVDRYFPSSQLCSHCGAKGGRRETQVRQWQCAWCGAVLHRDYNACANLIKQVLE